MDKIDQLIEEHSTLRLLAKRIEARIGAQTGVGWDDVVCCRMPVLREAQERFRIELAEHERREECVIGSLLRRCGPERAELEPALHRAHASLDGMTALLSTLSNVCDGTHVHAVRTMAARLREELESHLAYEEKVLFPLLRRRCGPPALSRRADRAPRAAAPGRGRSAA